MLISLKKKKGRIFLRCHMVAMMSLYHIIEFFWKQLQSKNKIVELGVAAAWVSYLKLTGAVP